MFRTIRGARISPVAAGLPLIAFVQPQCHPGLLPAENVRSRKFPETVGTCPLSDSSCTMVKVWTAMAHLHVTASSLFAVFGVVTALSGAIVHSDAVPPTEFEGLARYGVRGHARQVRRL